MHAAWTKLRQAATQFWDESVLGNTSDIGTTPKPVEAADEITRLYGLHKILAYDQYDSETGLFFNDQSIGFCFEVIPQTGADESIAARLNTLFTPLPAGVGLQWCLFGGPTLDRQFKAYTDLRRIAADKGQTLPFFVDLAQRRVSYLERNKGGPLWPTDNFVIKQTRLVISVTRSVSGTDRKRVQEMTQLRDTVHATLKTANLPAFPLDADGLIDFLWPILNPETLFSKGVAEDHPYDSGKSIKDQVTALGQHVRVKPKELLFGLPPQADEPDTRIAVRGFGVLRYPPRKELWEMANIIGSFFDEGLQYPCPFLICGGVYTLDPDHVDATAHIKAIRTKQNARSRMADFQPELVAQAQDWDIVLHQVNSGGTLCELYHTLLLFSPVATLERASQVAQNIWRNERFSLYPLQLLQLSALYTSLPMTLTAKARDDLKTLRLITTKTTVNAVDMAPVLAEWRGAGEPVMLLCGRRGGPAFLDFYANTQGNYNVFVAGVSGSGKSVLMNEIVSSYRGAGGRVWVIDVGRSYQNLIALQKGTFLEFTPTTRLCINPFSWIGTDSELDFKAEMRLLKPMIGRMASPNAPLTEFQYALIDEAITQTWKDYGPDTNPTRIRDYLRDKIQDEAGGTERIAYELAKQLAPFTADGVFGSFFNGQANISLDDDMVGLELEELKNAPELRRVVLFVLTSRIAHDMYLTRDRKKLCLVDEAWQLLGADKETAEFIEEGYRRARKYNGIFCVGTQGIEDAYKSPASQAAYTNADWKIFLRQDRKNLEKLIEDGVVNFSPAVKRMLLSLRTEAGRFSEMLVSSPNGDAVLRHLPDPFSLVMASTNAADYNECRSLLDAGYSTLEALETMAWRRQPPQQGREARNA